MAGSNREISAFAEAAQGLLEFRRGNFEKGSEHYLNSIRISREMKRADYIVNAAIFWLDQQVHCGLVPRDTLQDELSYIQRAIEKLPAGQAKDIGQTFVARKASMERAASKLDGVERHPAHEPNSHQLDVG
ncbi:MULTISPECIES: hypothetical protein [unclassified Sphingomonas]|uniref:hypothetical protein n=1 Tax=unclassified Sphingomonas TaxID=196159 RepID=UPI002151D179|nr:MULTISPECIES: hypothetical protein [unclassified Sphingomonas]MCR5869430.1 hypothetical protein [Sphingomonas sp. J344]UUX98841.1 hypothetical protein LRS08_15165 [Sphingomonas sp. J315]